MNKDELKEYIPEICKKMKDNIVNLLNIENINGDINFYYLKDNEINKIVFNIYIPINSYEKHYNTDIPNEYSEMFFEHLFKILLKSSLEDYECIVSKLRNNGYYNMDVRNINGSRLGINLFYRFNNLRAIMEDYNNEIDNYLINNKLIKRKKR